MKCSSNDPTKIIIIFNETAGSLNQAETAHFKRYPPRWFRFF